MQVRHLLGRFLTRGTQATLMLALTAGLPHAVSATKLVGTDINSGKLLYIETPKTVVTIANTGTKPDGVILGPNQQIIYALSGAGEVHSFNPYTHTDTTLAKGLNTPVNIVLEPGCKSILVSDIGVNKIFRITLANRALTTFYNGPDKMQGLTYDTNAQLFANDEQLNAIVQLDPTGTIINQTPANSPLTTLDGLTYDNKTNALFATSNTAQVIYKVSTDLTTVSTINFPGAPVLEGIVSDGQGTLYVVGVNGTSSTIFKYAILTATQTTLNTVSGLDDIALIPFGPCIKSGGTASVCEEMPDDAETQPGTLPN
jgi:sugar lactone lactonase YvrE